jgi:hypothetical protein
MLRKFHHLISFSLLLCLLLSTSCKNESSDSNNTLNKDSIELEKSKIELDRMKLEIEKEKINQEKNRILEGKQNEQTIALAQKAQQFNINPTGIVTSDKAFFYSAPDYNTRKKSYLVKGDIIDALKVSNNFLFIEFYSEYLNKTSRGWIDVNDVEQFTRNY